MSPLTDEQLEALLQSHRPADPAPALKARIVTAARTRSQWAFAEAMAGILLIGLNLSLIAASVTHVLPQPSHINPSRTHQIATALDQLDLPLSQQDTQTMAEQLAAGEHLVRVPILHAPSQSIALNIGGMQ
jgi:hypothetical protein